MNSRHGPHERASEQPAHPSDHKRPLLGLAIVLATICVSLLLIAVGVSAFVGAHWGGVQAS